MDWMGAGGLLVGGASFASLPASRVLTRLETPAQGYLVSGAIPVGPDGSVILPANYVIQFDEPAFVRTGSLEAVRLRMEPGGRQNANSPLAGSPVSVEASLEMQAQPVHPEGSIYQRLEAENPARFQWQITGAALARVEGTLWITLHFALPESDQPVKVLVLARPLSLPVRSIFALPAAVAATLSTLGLLAGCALGLPAVLPDIRHLWRISGRCTREIGQIRQIYYFCSDSLAISPIG
jgi:hypothetical protein